MIMHSLTLGRDINLWGGLYDDELEALLYDIQDPNMAPGIRAACEAAIHLEMCDMPSSYGEDERGRQFEGWED
jgi:hypothetical protein